MEVGVQRRNAWMAWLGAWIATTGAQLIAPTLPVMRDALGLDEAQLALVMSVYLLPAALASIPIGMLADRIGRRLVFGGALLVFGLCGLVYPLVASSFGLLLAVRFVQGVMFAGILPLTMTILGDVFTGSDLVGAQGRRSVAISLGDGIMPVVGGLLVTAGWFVPWLGQALAIPLGIAVLVWLVDAPGLGRARPGSSKAGIGALARLHRHPPVLALQYVGSLRMFLKFAVLTFLPVFLVDVRGQTPAFAGLAVGAAALSGTALAAVSGRLARLATATPWVMGGMVAMGAALVAVAMAPWPAAILALTIAYGAADGVVGVFINSLVTAATGAEQRASFVAATGALRNFAKFLGPAASAALVGVMPLSAVFVLLGGATAASSLSGRLLRPLQERMDGAPSSGASRPAAVGEAAG